MSSRFSDAVVRRAFLQSRLRAACGTENEGHQLSGMSSVYARHPGRVLSCFDALFDLHSSSRILMLTRRLSFGLCALAAIVAGCTSARDRARADSMQALALH